MTPVELAAVEAEVNGFVRQNTPVETRIMTPDAAEKLGARALFGEKYGDEVRVVSMGSRAGSGLGPTGETYSLELCGGTHVRRTGDIGAFKLVGEGASASGVRRIEALTGAGALAHVAAEEAALAEAAALLRARPDELAERVRALLDERKAQAQEIADLRRRLALAGGPAEAKGPETVAGVPFLAQSADRRLGQGPARADRRAQGAARLRRDPARRRHRRQGGGGGRGHRRPDDAHLRRRSRPRRRRGARRQGRWRPSRHGPGRWRRPRAGTAGHRRSPRPPGGLTMPKGYLIARIDVTDPDRYAKYVAATPGLAARHGGRFIARGGRFVAKEGTARARNAIIEFPDFDSAIAFYEDPDYQAVLPHAIAGSEREIVIVEGADDI